MTEKTREWFADWFDSPYYHLLYKHRDDREAEKFMDNLSEFLNFSSEHKILDIPCGKGRHSVYLNKKGYNVVGADLSENSIHKALKFANPRLEFWVHDMRLPLEDEAFDFVLNLFTSFGYFDDESENIQALESFKASLKQEGKMVIDFMNTPLVVKNLVPEEKKSVEGVTFDISRYVEDGTIVKEINFEAEGRNYHYNEKVRALTCADFERYFEKAGLRILSKFGNYNLEQYSEENSERMIFVLEKV